MASYNAEKAHIQRVFPRLAQEGYKITSPPDGRYNCIAWAAGENNRWWWPAGHYWPGKLPRSLSISAFVMAFSEKGYVECSNSDLEEGVEKIALYADETEKVTHAARQLPDGKWTSKLGSGCDIAHTLEGLESPKYGKVAVLLRRQP